MTVKNRGIGISILVGMYNEATALANNLAVSQNIKHGVLMFNEIQNSHS